MVCRDLGWDAVASRPADRCVSRSSDNSKGSDHRACRDRRGRELGRCRLPARTLRPSAEVDEVDSYVATRPLPRKDQSAGAARAARPASRANGANGAKVIRNHGGSQPRPAGGGVAKSAGAGRGSFDLRCRHECSSLGRSALCTGGRSPEHSMNIIRKQVLRLRPMYTPTRGAAAGYPSTRRSTARVASLSRGGGTAPADRSSMPPKAARWP